MASSRIPPSPRSGANSVFSERTWSGPDDAKKPMDLLSTLIAMTTPGQSVPSTSAAASPSSASTARAAGASGSADNPRGDGSDGTVSRSKSPQPAASTPLAASRSKSPQPAAATPNAASRSKSPPPAASTPITDSRSRSPQPAAATPIIVARSRSPTPMAATPSVGGPSGVSPVHEVSMQARGRSPSHSRGQSPKHSARVADPPGLEAPPRVADAPQAAKAPEPAQGRAPEPVQTWPPQGEAAATRIAAAPEAVSDVSIADEAGSASGTGRTATTGTPKTPPTRGSPRLHPSSTPQRLSPPAGQQTSAGLPARTAPSTGMTVKKRPAAAPTFHAPPLAEAPPTKRFRMEVPNSWQSAAPPKQDKKTTRASRERAVVVAPAVDPLKRSPHELQVAADGLSAPEKPPPLVPSVSRRDDMRGLILSEVPIEAFKEPEAASAEADGQNVKRRPRRTRMRPLERWRNERVRFERADGSELPTVAGVVLNCAPRPINVQPRELPVKILQSVAPEGVAAEFVGLETESLKNKVISLPGWDPSKTKRPHTVILDGTGTQDDAPLPATGMVHVLHGQIRMRQATAGEENAEAELGAGDMAVVDCSRGHVLVASSAHSDNGARLLWVVVQPLGKPQPLPLQPPQEAEPPAEPEPEVPF